MTRSIYFPQGRPSAGFLGSKSFFAGIRLQKWQAHLAALVAEKLTDKPALRPPSQQRKLTPGVKSRGFFIQVLR
jgi:hypothetical protein